MGGPCSLTPSLTRPMRRAVGEGAMSRPPVPTVQISTDWPPPMGGASLNGAFSPPGRCDRLPPSRLTLLRRGP